MNAYCAGLWQEVALSSVLRGWPLLTCVLCGIELQCFENNGPSKLKVSAVCKQTPRRESRERRIPNSNSFVWLVWRENATFPPPTHERTKCAVTTKQSLPPSLSHKHSINQHDEQRPTRKELKHQHANKRASLPPSPTTHSLTHSLTHSTRTHRRCSPARTHSVSQSVIQLNHRLLIVAVAASHRRSIKRKMLRTPVLWVVLQVPTVMVFLV